MYIVVDHNFKEIPTNLVDEDKYPYQITPTKIGNFNVKVVFQNKEGAYLIGNPCIVFNLKVV